MSSVANPAATPAVLVSLDLNEADYAESLEELRQLADSAAIESRAVVEGRRARPDPALFAGSGKVDEIAGAIAAADAVLVIFNHELSGAQQRNLEQRLKCRVIDRTSLILDIFAQRARSHEGKLQVELAQLEYLSTRLVRGWTHLERQRGGLGKTGGPGEKQIELDRRLLGKRVKVLRDKLAQLAKQRGVQRRARQRANVMSVSLVGYTNAGKSTLFNALTHAHAYTADQLFATLDTTTRKLRNCSDGAIVLSDTVGFIRSLPHTLVDAFRATLEETAQADLLLHVVDAANPGRDARIDEVNSVLNEIGARDIPQILVMNKIDVSGRAPAAERDEYGKISRIWLSAVTRQGLDLVPVALDEVRSAAKSATSMDSIRALV
ncbi:MAG: GTPase HflX [Burkholderiales bacterium]|nr:GTPase HflX [Burkholderiales bacterium]MDQ3196260.1 GTPase HflX [Pseudomonadota bacterium]